MGSIAPALGPHSQQLNRQVAATSSATGTATFTFQSPPQGYSWTGTLSCATANTGTVFTATIGATSWGQWGGNSVFGPVQASNQQQLVVTATGLTANTSYVLTWIGSSDLDEHLQPIWPDSNSTALTAQISGTVPISGTVTTGPGSVSSVSGTVGVSGTVATTPGATTINGAGFTGASTSLTVASTATFPSSGYLTIPGSLGPFVFAYTGTTGTSFTGVSLVSGIAAATIANGATVSQASSVAAQATNNNPYVSLGSAVGNNTTTITFTTTVPINISAVGLYVAGGATDPWAQLQTVLVQSTNPSLGVIVFRDYQTINQVTATQTRFFATGAQANVGDTLTITLTFSGVRANTTTAYFLGYSELAVQYAQGPPNSATTVQGGSASSLSSYQIGGVSYTSASAATAVSTLLAPAPATGTAYRLHSWGVANNVATLPVTGGLILQTPTRTFGTFVPASGSVYYTGSQPLFGQICTEALSVFSRTGSTSTVFVNYDLITVPVIV